MDAQSQTDHIADADSIRRLSRLGWLPDSEKRASPARARAAVKKFQRWAGLEPDGVVGPITTHHLLRPRICGTPDAVLGAETLCKWPHREITWAVLQQLPGVPIADFRAAARWAIGRWAAVCDILPTLAGGGASINIALTVANLGGPGGVLADSQLPCGSSRNATMRQRYDSSELWHAGEGPPSEGKLSLRAVVLHELGHALGIPHLPPDGPTGVMQPFYRADVLDLLPPDVEQAVQRYGEPQGAPPPSDEVTYRITVTSRTEPRVERV